jgi:FdhE protein
MSAVASIVRGSAPYAGYRYLCCGLCESQWHRVRAQCTECGSSKNVAYQLIEEGPPAVRAETCDDCRVYRKIVLQELDPLVDPLADDLASLALDLLLSEAGFERAGANPLYWQPAG